MRFRNLIRLMAAFAAAAFGAAAHAQSATFVSYISSGLSAPIGMVHAGDGSNRLFIWQQGGALRVVRNNVLLTPPLITLNGTTTCQYPGTAIVPAPTVGFTGGGERGLLGAAFHPSFASNGLLFLSFTDVNGDTMIARYQMASPAADVMTQADRDTCLVILRVDQDFTNHNGGNIVFGPDSYLYFGLGDGGSGGDPCNRAQTLSPSNLSGAPSGGSFDDCPADNNFLATPQAGVGDPDSRALLGKMLRLDIDGTTATPGTALCGEPRLGQPVAYAIPPGQPSAGAGNIAAACDEVWSYGLRNPWRFSFDRTSGNMFIGDVGQGSIEEVDFEPAGVGGSNYGWRCFEGNSDVACNPNPVGDIKPIIEYDHSAGRCSITGGFRYRGPVIPAQGRYFYGDYCTGEIWSSIPLGGGAWEQPGAPFQDMNNIASFGQDEVGNLYVTNGNQIWRLSGPVLPEGYIHGDGFEDPQPP
jgi:glucose/arabinose dehydrogenase